MREHFWLVGLFGRERVAPSADFGERRGSGATVATAAAAAAAALVRTLAGYFFRLLLPTAPFLRFLWDMVLPRRFFFYTTSGSDGSQVHRYCNQCDFLVLDCWIRGIGIEGFLSLVV